MNDVLRDTLLARDQLLPDLRHRHIDTPKTPDDDAEPPATNDETAGLLGQTRRWCVSFGVPRLLLICADCYAPSRAWEAPGIQGGLSPKSVVIEKHC